MGNLAVLRQAVAAAAPALTLLIAILLLVVPLRLGQGYIPTPLLPLIVVFLYSVYDPEALPVPVVFGLGLFHDLLYGGGLGIWASVYLAMQYLVYTQREYLHGRVARVIWLAFAVAALMVSFLLWLEQSLLAGAWLPILPLGYQIFITIAVYPLLSMLFFYLRSRAEIERRARS